MKKGTLEYLPQLKKKYMISALIATVFVFIQFLLRNFSQEWISRYLTIGMGIAIIPIGLYGAKLVSIWSYKQEDAMIKALEKNPELCNNALLDLIIVNGKASYYINAIFYADGILWLYTKNKLITSDIVKGILNRKALDIEVSITNSFDVFIDTMKTSTIIPMEVETILFQISS